MKIPQFNCVCALAIASLLSACGSTAPSASDDSLVRTQSGDVVGYEGDHDTYVWKGIPYAAPPVAALRWRAPQPIAPWQGVHESLAFGPACVQPANPTSGPNAPESEHVVGVEDCLTLNIFAPQKARSGEEPLPVMFWIHGGANMMGSSQLYESSRLADGQNVVVVSINYRLGLLGWFRHASLRPPGASLADHSGNYGTLDIIAALEWVRDNIEEFGGDPGRVTVFGESAGGRNVWSMVQTPLAKGLFHGAIVQSGSLKIMDAQKSERIDEGAIDYPSHENNGEQLVAKIVPAYEGMDSETVANELRGKTPDEIYAQIIPHPQGMYEQPRLFLDGHVFVQPALELFEDPSKYNAVPIITGTNRDEDKLFMLYDPRWVDFRFGFLPKVKDEQRYNAAAALGADTWRVYSVDVPAQVITEHGGPPVYTYRFDFDDLSDTIVDLSTLIGAAHSMEIPFVFGTHVESPWSWIFSNKEQRSVMSNAMMSYWGNFAYTGNPGKGSAGEQVFWPQWQEKGEHIMLFDTQNDGGVRMVEDRLKVDDIKQRLLSDAIFSREERCVAYPLILLNGYMVSDGYDETEHKSLCE
jgi:para-nitrobenzyl esterase